MPTTNYTYTNPSNYSFDKTSIAASIASLALQNNTGKTVTSPFTTPGNYTYDPAKVDLSTGVARLLDLTPANSVFGATYTSSLNGSFGTAPLTATSIGAPAITANRLNVTGGGDNAVRYQNTAIGTIQSVGAIKLKYTPNYTGAPALNSGMIELNPAAGNNDRMILFHGSTGWFRFSAWNNVGTPIHIAVNIGATAWLPTSGVTYELELNFNCATGVIQVYIDGVLKGASPATAFTRAGSSDRLRVGSSSAYTSANAYFEDVVAFNTVQHTVGYTPGYTLPETRYDLTNPTIVLEAHKISYAAPYGLTSVNSIAATETGAAPLAVRYDVSVDDGATWMYWNGAAWAVNGAGYTNAINLATLTANIGSLDVATTDKFKLRVFLHSDVGVSTPTVDDIIVTYTDFSYPTEGTVLTSTPVLADGINNIAVLPASQPASTALQFVVSRDGVLYYYSGSWQISDGTFAQSNTIATILTNIATLITTGTGRFVRFLAVLQSSLYSATPSIDNLEVDYNYQQPATAPGVTIVSGYVYDNGGVGINGATVQFKPISTEWAEENDSALASDTRSVVTNAQGYFEISLISRPYYVKHYKQTTPIYSVSKKDGELITLTPSGVYQNITDLIN